MAPPLTSVLRIGPTDNNASAALLKTALLSHFETKDDPNVFTVSNRYFAAKVRLQDITEGQASTSEGALDKDDGIIVVFDAVRSNPDIIGRTTSSSFDALTLVHNQAEQQGECGDLLRLCVGVSVGSKSPTEMRGQKHEDEYSRRVLWCLDRGYEYVEADLSAEGQKSGHDERDKDGFARIVEAISGTVWSSAVMEKSKQQQLNQSYEKEKEALQDDAQDENRYVPPDSSLLSDDAVQDGSNKIQSSLVSESEKEDSNDYFVDESKIPVADQERAMENLEGLLREASRIREASRDGELSDDERRKRAADAATLMMSLMTQLDVEGDQDDDFEVDSSSDKEENG